MSRSDDAVLVMVEGVSKKFCRSLKKSLWYGEPTKSAVAGDKQLATSMGFAENFEDLQNWLSC
jgi:hypothetical protein